MPGRSDARANAITTAARLFDRQGYHGTGLTQILEDSGAPKGSFYFHFPEGKQQLGVEAVAASGRQVDGLIADAIARYPGQPADAVKAAARALARWLKRTDFREGCAVAAMTIEAASISPEIQTACRDAYASWHATFAVQLRTAGLDAASANNLSSLIVSSLEGAVILSRAQQSTSPVDTVGVQLADLIHHSLRRQ